MKDKLIILCTKESLIEIIDEIEDVLIENEIFIKLTTDKEMKYILPPERCGDTCKCLK